MIELYDRGETIVNLYIRQPKYAQRILRRPMRLLMVAALFVSVMLATFLTPPVIAGTANQYFPQTGQTVSDPFLSYWRANGGLRIFGYPISPARYELDPGTGKALFVQWFERARLEQHLEWAGTRQEIQLSLLGRQFTQERQHLPEFKAIAPFASTADTWFFSETGHSLSVGFKQFWEQHGGLPIFGYPISEAFPAQNPINGQWYSVQYFERARFEYHPYNAPDYQIELGVLGRQLIQTARPVAPGPRQTVKIYLIDPSVPFDVARGMGLVPIEVQIAPTKRVLRAAIETLLSLPKNKRADGLINALADSHLRVNDVTLVRGKATLALSGQFKVAGVGAEAYTIAQLRATARQFPTVKDVVILVNGCPLPVGETSGCTNLS
jgi:hypothetical protein